MPVEGIIAERLEALNSIDENIVSILEGLCCIFDSHFKPSSEETRDILTIRKEFDDDVKGFYTALSSIAIGLRKEVKVMDDNTGTSKFNDDSMMILPVSVDKKNTTLGEKKLETELKKLRPA